MTAERIEPTRFDALGFHAPPPDVIPHTGWKRAALVEENRRGQRPRSVAWWLRLLVLPLLALLALGVWFGVGRIEAGVTEGARLALEEAGIATDTLLFEASFRDIEIGGTLPTGSDPETIEDLLEGQAAPNGAQIRTATVTAVRITSSFDVRVVADGRTIILSGSVPLDTHRRQLTASAALAGVDVIDRLNVADLDPVVPDPDALLAPLLAALPSLGSDVSAARLSLFDDGLTGEVEARTPNAGRNLNDSVDTGIDVSALGELDVSLAWDGNLMVLDGTVVDPAHADALRSAAVAAVGRPRLIENLKEVDSAASVASTDATIEAVVDLLNVLDDFTAVELQLSDTDLAVTGAAFDPDAEASIEAVIDTIETTGLEVATDLSLSFPFTAEQERDRLQSDLDALEDDIRANVRFQSDSLVLDEPARATLDEVVAAMTRYSRPVVEVGGHTDSQGEASFNEALSLSRADAVVAYLREQGVATDRLNPVGYGESRPIAENLLEAGREKNRRVEFTARASF